MSEKKLLKCVTCGKSYSGCRTCEEARNSGMYRWRQSCDTMECFQVHLVLKDYYYKVISKEAAKNLLKDILTEDMKPYDPNSAWLIEEVMAEPPEEKTDKQETTKTAPKQVHGKT